MKLQSFTEHSTGMNTKKWKTMSSRLYDDVEKVWFLQERSRGTPILEPIICEKALQFHRELHGKEYDKFQDG